MKVKARQRGGRTSSAQNEQQEDNTGQKPHQQPSNDSIAPSPCSARADGNVTASGSSGRPATSGEAKGRGAAATTAAPSVAAAAASRPPLLIGTTSAATRSTPATRALTQQQLRRQRQQQRAAVPPVRVRGAAAGGRQGRGAGGAGAAAAATAAAAAAGAAAGGSTLTSATALAEVVKAVERALEDGPAGQERLVALSVEQPDLYSQVILALFQKTQSLELISRLPMPVMPEPDFMLDPPMPGADFDFDLGWEEGDEGDELEYWEAMGAAGAAAGGGFPGGYGLYDMPYDLAGMEAPFPEPPFPGFDDDPDFDDEYDDEYEDYDEDEEGEAGAAGYRDVGTAEAGTGTRFGGRRGGYYLDDDDDGVDDEEGTEEDEGEDEAAAGGDGEALPTNGTASASLGGRVLPTGDQQQQQERRQEAAATSGKGLVPDALAGDDGEQLLEDLLGFQISKKPR